MKRGEIWLISLDPTLGHEKKGRSPVLIVSPEAGTKTAGVVRCDQPRTLDLAARGGRKLERVADAIMDEVLAKVSPIFE